MKFLLLILPVEIQVVVKGQKDEIINLEVEMKTRVSKIKEMLAETTGQEVKNIHLMRKQDKMIDHKILAHYDLNESDIIILSKVHCISRNIFFVLFSYLF